MRCRYLCSVKVFTRPSKRPTEDAVDFISSSVSNPVHHPPALVVVLALADVTIRRYIDCCRHIIVHSNSVKDANRSIMTNRCDRYVINRFTLPHWLISCELTNDVCWGLERLLNIQFASADFITIIFIIIIFNNLWTRSSLNSYIFLCKTIERIFECIYA